MVFPWKGLQITSGVLIVLVSVAAINYSHWCTFMLTGFYFPAVVWVNIVGIPPFLSLHII